MKIFWTDCELIPELTSSQCNWKGNQKGKGTDETPQCSFKNVIFKNLIDITSIIQFQGT